MTLQLIAYLTRFAESVVDIKKEEFLVFAAREVGRGHDQRMSRGIRSGPQVNPRRSEISVIDVPLFQFESPLHFVPPWHAQAYICSHYLQSF